MRVKLSKLFTVNKGFTLIELLVVLGILGILAAALLAAINPVEQLNKAQDASLEQIATEFVNANARYYTTTNAFPWYSTANGGANCDNGTTSLSAIALSSLSTCVTTLVSSGELKSSFSTTANLNQLSVTNAAGSTSVITCFQPKSHSVQTNANTKFTQSGGAGTSCISTGGTNSCYWCSQ